jgi:hypothetical protein
MSNATPLAPTGATRFWPNFTVAAVLTPLVWLVMEGLTMPDWVVSFYAVSMGAVPLAFAAVVLPAWRLMRANGNPAMRLAAALLALPSLAIALWGTYTALWLLYLAATGQL